MNKFAEKNLFDETHEKLEKLTLKTGLLFLFQAETYPIMLSVWPDPEVEAQLDMLGEENIGKEGACIVFIFADGEIIVRTTGKFTLPDALMSKIKGYAKKLHYFYLQAYHRQAMTAYNAPTQQDSQE